MQATNTRIHNTPCCDVAAELASAIAEQICICYGEDGLWFRPFDVVVEFRGATSIPTLVEGEVSGDFPWGGVRWQAELQGPGPAREEDGAYYGVYRVRES